MPGYQFPEEYQSHIVGGALTPDLMDVPYKGYTENLNLNSVKQSQSMFARRVFELMASNTLVISNFSRGLRLMFGDLAITTDSGTEMRRRLERIDAQPCGRERLRAMALRKVLQEHTYADRLAFIAEEAGIDLEQRALEKVGLVAVLRNESDAARAQQIVATQTYPNVHLVLLDQRPDLEPAGDGEHVTPFDTAVETVRSAGCTLIGVVDPRNFYGPDYILDLVHTLRWADVPAAGHHERFAHLPGHAVAASRLEEGTAFTAQPELALPRSLVRSEVFADWAAGSSAAPGIDATGPGLAVGVAEYFENGADASAESLAYCLPLDIDTGASLKVLRTFADQQIITDSVPSAAKTFDIAPLVGSMAPNPSVSVTTDAAGRVLIDSELAAERYVYVIFQKDLPRNVLPGRSSPTLYLDTPPGLDFLLVIYYLDGAGKRLAHSFVRPRINNDLTIPEGVRSIRFGLRVSGPGSTVIKNIFLERYDRPRQPLLTRSTTLVATNVYPSYDNLYRNGFVHSRTRSYLAAGHRTDVFRVGPHPDTSFAEFEDLDTAWIDPDTLERTLAQGGIERVLVHFLDRGIWDALKEHPEVPQVIVWVHGAEVQPWWRRQYNYSTEAELEAAKPASDARLKFWREVFTKLPENFHFAFVSQYFADEVFEDVGITLDEDRYSIIHNPIDTEIFTYVNKPDEQRRKVLTIRPYASPKYANDLSVAAICAIKDRPGFEDIEFRVIGDGVLFDETLEPLRDLPNVSIERGFLTHSEIAAMHKDYGVFLTPTRMDAQGVSRDEAMSSGLVPISTDIAAIPEFMDESCGFLAPPECHEEIAEAIWTLAHDSELFQRLSSSAADRVRRQTASTVILPQELDLIFGDADDAI
jgi:glycosyltransferase involved in cell wall biosynthesis